MMSSIIPRDVLKHLIGSNLGFGSIGILLGPKLCQYAIVVCKTCSIVCYFTDACIAFSFYLGFMGKKALLTGKVRQGGDYSATSRWAKPVAATRGIVAHRGARRS